MLVSFSISASLCKGLTLKRGQIHCLQSTGHVDNRPQNQIIVNCNTLALWDHSDNVIYEISTQVSDMIWPVYEHIVRIPLLQGQYTLIQCYLKYRRVAYSADDTRCASIFCGSPTPNGSDDIIALYPTVILLYYTHFYFTLLNSSVLV